VNPWPRGRSSTSVLARDGRSAPRGVHGRSKKHGRAYRSGTTLAILEGVLRPSFVASLSAALVLGASARADAFGWLSSGALTPIEQRIALSVGPGRTTTWTSLRLESGAGAIGVVVPAPSGASLDWSSSSWLEALEVATAPRIFPPDGAPGVCPGDPADDPFHIAGTLEHVTPLFPAEVVVLADADAVGVWAADNGLTMSPGLAAALASLGGTRFVGARFGAPAGTSLTPTLRVVSPGGAPALPLVLTRAGGDDLLVTTWVIGQGRARLDGTSATVDPADISFRASTATSTYAEVRATALAEPGPGAFVIESAGHDTLASNLPIADGTASIEGVITAYFGRAAAYGDGLPDSAACVTAAATALASSAPVASSCARADLGVVDGVPGCTETVAPGETDPAALRCGDGADDLAVALSGQAPLGSWLTRQTLILAAGTTGTLRTVTFPGGAEILPVLRAGSVDLGGCDEPDAATGTSTSASASSGGPASGAVSSSAVSTGNGGGDRKVIVTGSPVVYEACVCEGDTVGYDPYETYYGGEGGEGGAGEGGAGEGGESDETYAGSEDDCGGDSSDSYESESESDDGCSGDSSDSSESDSDDGCSGDSSDSSDSDSDDGCSGDSSDSSGDDSSNDDASYDDSSDDGAEGSSGDSTESGSASACSVAPIAPRRPRLSLWMLAGLFVIAPVRRILRPRRLARR
jgi:hypothetical protein